ncbi:MAG: LacI family transcriptional regulator [Spirochaetes bacterium]|nr:LacI family transcriptional regulator [Spirochaetota bacterium]
MKTFAKNNKNITIKDIAQMANVSYSTVSRCLNDSKLVSEKTKNKVKKIADELGFEFNASARGLVTRKSGSIGIILPDNFNNFDVYIHHISLMNQMRTILEKEDFDLIVTFWRNHFTGQDNIRKMIHRRKVDGIILLKQQLDLELVEYLNENQFPYIFSHYPVEIKNADIEAIFPDNFKGGYIAGKHLIDLGYTNIICINVDKKSTLSKEFDLRVDGFQQAFKDSGKKYHMTMLFGNKSFQSGYNLVNDNLAVFKKTDALFAVTDLMAFGVLKGLTENQIKVPDNIAVVGYDNTELCNFSTPTLTSISQPLKEISKITCDELITKINSSEPINMRKKVLISPYLVKRESCGWKK